MWDTFFYYSLVEAKQSSSPIPNSTKFSFSSVNMSMKRSGTCSVRRCSRFFGS